MKYTIKIDEQARQRINKLKEENKLRQLTIDEGTVCRAIIASFYERNYITDSEYTSLKNDLAKDGNLAASI